MWLKICGVRTPRIWEVCAEAGASAVGFVFWPGSPRFIMPAEAGGIGTHGPVRCRPERAGVFCDASRDEVLSAFREAKLDWVQLHGSESIDFAVSLGVPWVKAVRVGGELDTGAVRLFGRAGFGNRYILDARSDALPGGTGRSFDWRIARRAKGELPSGYRLILSGGIGAGNAKEAIETVKPFGLDLSSSVESSPGVKDEGRIRRLGSLILGGAGSGAGPEGEGA